MLELIQTIAAAGQTMIIVTHEMAFARQVASRVVFMENGEIVEQGPAEQIFGAAQQGRTRAFWRNCTIILRLMMNNNPLFNWQDIAGILPKLLENLPVTLGITLASLLLGFDDRAADCAAAV